MAVVLGIDAGTSKIGGVALSADGRLLASCVRPNNSARADLPSTRAAQSPTVILERVLEVLRELSGVAPRPAAIGFCGQMHGLLCVDADRTPLTDLITWQDQRCLEPRPAGPGCWLDEFTPRAPADDVACGCRLRAGYGGASLAWLTRNDALPTTTACVCTVADWLAATLADARVTTDPTSAASWGLLGLATNEWRQEAVAALGLAPELLPTIGVAGEVIGGLSQEFAAAVGLPPDTPVCRALGDSQASFLGSGAGDDAVLVNIGTGGQVCWVTAGVSLAFGCETRPLPPDRLLQTYASLSGGGAYAALNAAVRCCLSGFGVVLDEAETYAHLNRCAADARPDCGGLVADTRLSGARDDPLARGGLRGASGTNLTLGNVSRAVLAGVVDELAAAFEKAHGAPPMSVIATGNAVRRNPLMLDLIARRFGAPVAAPPFQEEAAIGAALIAGVGAGVWNDWKAAARALSQAGLA